MLRDSFPSTIFIPLKSNFVSKTSILENPVESILRVPLRLSPLKDAFISFLLNLISNF